MRLLTLPDGTPVLWPPHTLQCKRPMIFFDRFFEAAILKHNFIGRAAYSTDQRLVEWAPGP
jgi:hypothetical protein